LVKIYFDVFLSFLYNWFSQKKEGQNMKVAAYIRVSTHEQAEEGYSIPAQRNRLEAYALSQGWEVVKWYMDEGESAKDLNRTDLSRMLKDLELGIFDCVLVYKLDRLTRSVMDLYKLLSLFDKFDVKFKSATEVYDTTTAIGRLFITIVSALAQWERENLGERVSMGMMQKAKEGKWTVSTPPFGYNSIDSVLFINPTEAAIVKEIYALYLSGMGMWKICQSLNGRGLYPRSGNPWYQNSVNYILKNPVYIGRLRYNFRVNTEQYFEIDSDDIPVIISEDQFLLVQRMIDNRRQSHPRQATSRYIFSKVLKCARCGTTLIGRSSSTKRGDKTYYSYNYYCPNTRRSLCDLPIINENFIEKKFEEMLEQWDSRKEAEEILNNEIAATLEDYTDIMEQMQNELKVIESRRNKWQYAWVNSMFSQEDTKNDAEFKKRMKEEEEKEKMIQQELDQLSKQESPIDIEDELEIWTDFKLNWSLMDREAKKQGVLIFLKSMKVDKVNSNKNVDSIELKEVRLN
jgi:site-specific DNA recombinase